MTKEHHFIKTIILFICIFLTTVIVLLLAIVSVACIPRSNIQNNMIESAEYYFAKSDESFIFPSVRATYLDRVADSLILNITYHIDSETPLKSTMWTSFYGYPNQYAEQYLLDSVNSSEDENVGMQEYLRYWHGSAVFLKIYHLFWNIRQIIAFHYVLTSGLAIVLLCMLWRKKLVSEVIGVIIALIAVSAWVAPGGLEFYWVFPVMLITSIVSVMMVNGNYSEYAYVLLFLIVGMITVYLDFLTSETITITVPLLLILKIRSRKREDTRYFLKECLFSFKCCASWLFGYLGMWAMKWLLAKMILNIEVMPYVTGHIEERMGSFSGKNLLPELKNAIIRNVCRLFPMDYGLLGAIVFVGVVICFFFIPVLQNRLWLNKNIRWKQIIIFALIGLIPYVRFIVMHSHSYGHYVLTFRAQIASVLALIFIISEIFEWNLGIKAVTENA